MAPMLFIYRIVTDMGVAPHISNDFLSLTICKPGIRKSASKGDYVLALVALQHGHLTGKGEDRFYKAAYLFEITEKVDMKDYETWCKSHAPHKICSDTQFEGDCQYDSALVQRLGPHGAEHADRNISGKFSLISSHFAAWKSDKPHTLTDAEIDAIGLSREQVKTATRNFFKVPLTSPSQIHALNTLIDGRAPITANTSACKTGRPCRGGTRSEALRSFSGRIENSFGRNRNKTGKRYSYNYFLKNFNNSNELPNGYNSAIFLINDKMDEHLEKYGIQSIRHGFRANSGVGEVITDADEIPPMSFRYNNRLYTMRFSKNSNTRKTKKKPAFH